MKIIYSALIIIFFLSVVTANATICYQEFANQSTTCGSNPNGYYLADYNWGQFRTRLYDGNWVSSVFPLSGTTGHFDAVYVVPSNMTYGILQMSDNCPEQKFNYTLRSEHLSGGIVKVQLIYPYPGNPIWYLFNYTTMIFNPIRSPTCQYAQIVEEGIYWSNTQFITTTTTTTTTSSTTTTTLPVTPTPTPTPDPNNCTYYIGDPSFSLPAITSIHAPLDTPTHKVYLACLYSLNGAGNFEVMSGSSCRASPQTYSPTTPSSNVYQLAIAYDERLWDQTSHQWITVGSGISNQTTYQFNVCDVPPDTGGWTWFISWIQQLMCSMFGMFCP